MKKLLLLFAVIVTAFNTSAENYILYTSSDGKVVNPHKSDVFGANIVSNTYENGQGKITFDGEVTTIGDEAFNNSSNLTSIEIPNTVTTIGRYAFSNCDINSVIIPNSVTTINDLAFYECKSLSKIEFGDSVKIIGNDAFRSCDRLRSVILPNSLQTIGNGAFKGCSFSAIKIPESVSTIGNNAFQRCRYLISVELPNSIKEIGAYMFESCESLSTLVIPNSVTTIGGWVCCSCKGLTSVVIGNSVTSIGFEAFHAQSTGLAEIISLNTTPPSAENYCFESVPKSSCVLKVPAASVELYKDAVQWRDFFNIVALTDEELEALPVESVVADKAGGKSFNLSGQRVDEGSKGIVIKDGKKFINR